MRPWVRLSFAACTAATLAACATTSADLQCALPTNCVSSAQDDPAPLRYDGNAERGIELLNATLASFPEAKVVRTEGLEVETIFTTRIGFRDRVEFRVDPQGGRIDYRSQSLFGLFDWGKNRSRMGEVREKFNEQVARR